jgi:hypothetical protein
MVASLIDTATGTTLWTERFEATSAAAVEHDLLLRTIGALPVTLTAEDQARIAATRKSAAPAKPTPAPAATRPTVPKQAAPALKPPTAAPLVETQPAPANGARPGSARRENGMRATPPPSSPAREQAPPQAPIPQRPAPAPEREIPQQS